MKKYKLTNTMSGKRLFEDKRGDLALYKDAMSIINSLKATNARLVIENKELKRRVEEYHIHLDNKEDKMEKCKSQRNKEKEFDEFIKLYHQLYPNGGPSLSPCSHKKEVPGCGGWRCRFFRMKRDMKEGSNVKNRG